MRLVRGLATGLGALKAKSELHEGATLTADEVDGIIWAVKSLRRGEPRVPADQPARR
jgi:hypothetical protein